MICKIKTLEYFNDRPVFEEERRTAEAWFTGAAAQERAEIAKIKEEK
jgi:hypothetical protein